MSYFNSFKQPIHNDDLKSVLYQVFYTATIGGLLIGALRVLIVYLMNYDPTWILLFLFVYFISNRIRQASYEKHQVFSLLGIAAFLIGFYIMNVTTAMGIDYIVFGRFLPNLSGYFNPIGYFYFLYPFQAGFTNINNVIDVVFFLIYIYYAYKRSS